MTATTNSELEDLILHIKGLVFVQALLEAQGAAEAELAEYTAELARQRRRLAELVRDGAGHPI